MIKADKVGFLGGRARQNTETRARSRLFVVLLQNKLAMLGVVMLILMVAIAVFAPQIAPYDPLRQELGKALLPPNREHPLGTDQYGRDVLSRVIYGFRVSLPIGFLSVALGAIVGSVLGLIAGYIGGVLDSLIVEGANIFLSFPDVLLGVIMLVGLGGGVSTLVVTLAILYTPRFVRLARAPTLKIKETAYVEVAKAIGQSKLKIMFIHILPNMVDELVTSATLWIAAAIQTEAALSFLGLGVKPPTPSWGGMIRDGLNYIMVAPWLSLYPGLAIVLVVLACNMVGDGLRDILDPRIQ